MNPSLGTPALEDAMPHSRFLLDVGKKFKRIMLLKSSKDFESNERNPAASHRKKERLEIVGLCFFLPIKAVDCEKQKKLCGKR